MVTRLPWVPYTEEISASSFPVMLNQSPAASSSPVHHNFAFEAEGNTVDDDVRTAHSSEPQPGASNNLVSTGNGQKGNLMILYRYQFWNEY
jgi:hypothetical protein